MKRANFIKSIFAVILCIALLFVSGCVPESTPFAEGVYESENDSGNPIISKVKLELKVIDEETFQNADGLNVICERISSEHIRYFSFELYVYLKETGAYQKLDVIGFEQQKGAPQTYYGELDASQENYGIAGFTFIYDEPFRILFYQDSQEFNYYIKLQTD